jgi:hypothetical protein
MQSAKIGDIIVDKYNHQDNWGQIIADERTAWKLNTGRIAKKENENIRWIIKQNNFSEREEQLILYVSAQNIQETNNELSKSISRYYIYHITWMARGYHDWCNYESTTIKSKLINATNREEAFYIALQNENYKDRPFLICKLIGNSYMNESKVLSVEKEDINA